jgi:hypothetical protein
LSSYVNPVTQQSSPPVLNNLQFQLGPGSTPSIVDPVQASIRACPSVELFLTVLPKLDITTVDPPGPVAPVALSHKVV